MFNSFNAYLNNCSFTPRSSFFNTLGRDDNASLLSAAVSLLCCIFAVSFSCVHAPLVKRRGANRNFLVPCGISHESLNFFYRRKKKQKKQLNKFENKCVHAGIMRCPSILQGKIYSMRLLK